MKLSLLISFALFTALQARQTKILSRVKRIVGGDLITKSVYANYRFAVSLQLLVNNSYSHFCGGTYVENGWIITAAHCVRQVNMSIAYAQIGGHDLDLELRTNITYRYKIVAVYSQNLDRYSMKNDIALVKVKFANPTPAMQYLHKSVTLSGDYNGNEYLNDCFIFGYGTTAFYGNVSTSLRYVNLKIIGYSECVDTMGRILAPPRNSGMFCAVGDDADACKGDSGGGLICKTDSSKYILVGVISYGLGCEGHGIPGVYTNVSAYHNWIYSIINSNKFNNYSFTT